MKRPSIDELRRAVDWVRSDVEGGSGNETELLSTAIDELAAARERIAELASRITKLKHSLQVRERAAERASEVHKSIVAENERLKADHRAAAAGRDPWAIITNLHEVVFDLRIENERLRDALGAAQKELRDLRAENEDYIERTNTMKAERDHWRKIAGEARAELCRFLKRHDAECVPLREALRNVRDNYDCDTDAHKHGTTCRACDARAALDGAEAGSYAGVNRTTAPKRDLRTLSEATAEATLAKLKGEADK